MKTTYLYGKLPTDEMVYMEQPKGFAEPGKEDWVWQLQRSLYSMKQSRCIWNKTMNKALLSWGFKHLSADSCIYYRKMAASIIITCIYINDFIIAGSSIELCVKPSKHKYMDYGILPTLGMPLSVLVTPSPIHVHIVPSLYPKPPSLITSSPPFT
jgi:hypothetical protein